MNNKFVKMNEPDYRGYKALNSSGINELINRSPMHYHYRYVLGNEAKPTDAMRFGTLFHHLVLEPEHEHLIKIAPFLNMRTKDGKAQFKAFTDQHPGCLITDEDDYNTARRMRDSLFKCKDAIALIENSQTEITGLFTADNGVECKFKADILTPDNTLCDLKTTRDASPNFMFNVAQYGYDIQAAFYLQGASKIINRSVDRFQFILVEKEPPYATAIREADMAVLDQGERKVERALEIYKKCVETNVWPGYEND